MDKFLKVSIAVAALIVALTTGYYFAIYVPHQEQAKLDQQQKEKQQAEQDAQQKAALNKALLSSCESDAQNTYNADWASNCKSNAQRVQAGLQSCLDQGLGQSFCASTWGKVDSSASCSLPTSLADSIDKQLQNDKDECFRKYPQQ